MPVAFVALALLAGCAMPAPEPLKPFPASGARQAATLFLSDAGPDRHDAIFSYPAVQGGETQVTLKAAQGRPVSVVVGCEGEARLVPAGETGAGLYMRPGATRRITVPGRAGGRGPVLVLPATTAQCQVSWGDGHRLALQRAPLAVPTQLPKTDCAGPVPPVSDPLARVFFATRALDMTCPAPTGPVEVVPGELDALKWRLDRLTGGNISRAALEAGDPDMPLDFSAAPHFDEIVVSYLLIRSDLSGWLTLRALAAHAASGTRVRILTSGDVTIDFDRRPFEALAAQYPNVSLQIYRWPTRRFDEGLVAAQRSNHVKLFLGLSPEPGRSFALIGGRNLTDGFFFDTPKSYPDHPFLHSYANEIGRFQGLVFHSLYDDFELALTDRAHVVALGHQFERYYERDAPSQAMVPPGPAPRPPTASDGVLRHFISQPAVDGWALEALLVDLFDAARQEIFVVSPFNYPTPAIETALLRAAARGVDVRIVTRRGADEPPAIFTKALNARFDDSRRGTFRFRIFDAGKLLLHTKIIVIDGRLGVVASSNLNRRSFLHDTENGLLFLDRDVARALHAEAERYWAVSSEDADPVAYTLPLALFRAVPWLEQFF